MDTRELFSRITRLPITAEGLVTNMLAGNFRSVFRGQGMEFDEARHYQWGDDAKSIDWNASTRLGTPFVKVYREERELSMMLLLDTSASMHSGIARPWGSVPNDSQTLSPYEQALLAAALIAFSAERSGQRVGAFLFDREISRVFPPRKGRRNVLAFVSGALQCHRPRPVLRQKALPPNMRSSNLHAAITATGYLLKRKSMVVLISDFLSVGWEQEMGKLGRRHDLIAIRVYDPGESELPDMGLLSVADPETGVRISAPTSSASFREAWAHWHGDRAELWQKLCRRAGATPLELPVTADAASMLTRFFGGRARRGN